MTQEQKIKDYLAKIDELGETACLYELGGSKLIKDCLNACLGGGWRPIETAPTTGALDKIIVICVNSKLKPQAMVGWPLRRDDKDYFTTLDGTFHAPTHWMPLPTPPEKES